MDKYPSVLRENDSCSLMCWELCKPEQGVERSELVWIERACPLAHASVKGDEWRWKHFWTSYTTLIRGELLTGCFTADQKEEETGRRKGLFYVRRLVPELYFWLKALTKGEGLCLCEFGVALWGWWGCFSLFFYGSEACWRTTGGKERKKGVWLRVWGCVFLLWEARPVLSVW